MKSIISINKTKNAKPTHSDKVDRYAIGNKQIAN